LIAGTIVAAVVGYAFAGIPVGLFIGRMKGIPDIREHGSGNIGATNVLRVLGVKAGLTVWIIDCLKGIIPILLARHVFGVEGWGVGVAGLAATFGHCYSPYLGFSGGRGVSTSLGVVSAMFWPTGVCSLLVFVVLVALTRYVSVGSMLASASAWVWMLVYGQFISPYTAAYATMAACCGLVIIIRHGPNIKRLLSGTERKLGEKAAVADQPGADDDSH